MASTDKKKVKITESSKQANVDITSETIMLPADSADEVIVAKVPSAANCTSGVNVEVEMSPDGTNWCPALRKEVVTTAGSSTAAVIGNEKYVDLQKKAPVYNSYGKGRLNFDINGNTVQSDSLGTGARDSLDQHIAVNKSFNYSMWVNSSTQPTSTYKPVLFRHGGKDDFENTKVVSLTAGTSGATSTVNTRSALGTVNSSNTPTNYDFHLGGTASTLPGLLPDQAGYQSYTNRMPSLMEAWSISCWVKIGNTGDTLGTSDYVAVWGFGSNVGKFQLFTYDGHLRASIGQTGGTEVVAQCGSARTAGQWYHCVVTKSAGTGSVGSGNQTDQGELKLYIDGALHDTQAIGTTLNDGNFYSQTINSTYISGPRYYNTNNYRSTGLVEIDELSSYNTNLHSDEVYALRNGTKAVDPTTIPVSGNKNIPAKISTYFRFGDASNDNVTGAQAYNQIDNAYRTANSRSTIATDPGTTTIESYNSRGTFTLMTSSDTLYNASSSSIISKTTQNLAQRIAYSNTSVVQSGAVKSTGYQARLGDPYQDWTVVHWSTPYKADNTTPINAQTGQVTIAYGPTAQFYSSDGTKRWTCDNSIYLGGQNSRLQVTNGWYGISGNYISGYGSSVPDLFNAAYAYPYSSSGPSAPGNEQSIKNESFLLAFTNSHNSSTGQSVTTRVVYNAIGTKIFETAITWEPTGTMPTTPNFFNRTDETVCYDIALNNAQIEAHFQDHPTQKQIDPTNTSSITYTTTPVISPVDPSTLNTWSNAILHIRGGDASGDSVTGLTNVKGANTHFPATITKSSSDLVFRDIGSTKGAHLASNDSQNIFSINNNLSISGWFKTTGSGTLFSNSNDGFGGLRCVLSPTNISINTGNQSTLFSHGGTLTDDNWHHIVFTKPTTSSPACKLYLDGVEQASSPFTLTNIDDSYLKGTQGFTLLSDGVENINKSGSPASLDSSKLMAAVSNWSLHKEILDQYAVKQLYSNGHVRNIKKSIRRI